MDNLNIRELKELVDFLGLIWYNNQQSKLNSRW